MATRLFKVGFATTDTAADVQYMEAAVSTSSNYDSFQQGGTAFQVTSGKTLYIGSIAITSTANFAQPSFFHSTASVSNSSSAPTGNTALGRGSSFYYGVSSSTQGGTYVNTTANGNIVYDVVFTIAQNLFFNLFSNNGQSACAAIGLMF